VLQESPCVMSLMHTVGLTRVASPSPAALAASDESHIDMVKPWPTDASVTVICLSLMRSALASALSHFAHSAHEHTHTLESLLL
jgi:hypothetical protein